MQRSDIVPIGVFKHSQDMWPVVLSLEFTSVYQVNKCGLYVQVELHCLHLALSPFKLIDKLACFLIDVLLEPAESL